MIKSEQFNEPDFIDSVHNDEDIKVHKPKEQPATPAKQVTKEAEHKKSVSNRGASPKSVKNDEEKILKKMEQSIVQLPKKGNYWMKYRNYTGKSRICHYV